MRELRRGELVRVRSSPTELSDTIYMISDTNIKGIGGLQDIPDPARLCLLIHRETFTPVLAYYMECEPVG